MYSHNRFLLGDFENHTTSLSETVSPPGGGGGGSGDTLSSATLSDNQVCRYDGENNRTIQPSLTTIDDTGRIYTTNGSATLPAYSFSAETGAGMYFNASGADSLGFSLAGTPILTVSPTFVKSTQPYRANDGLVTAPSYSFSAATSAGMFNAGSDILGFSSGGVLKFSVQPTTVESLVPLRLPNGTTNNPSYTFSSSPTSGLYYNGLGVSLGVSSTEVLGIRSNSVTLCSITSPQWNKNSSFYNICSRFINGYICCKRSK